MNVLVVLLGVVVLILLVAYLNERRVVVAAQDRLRKTEADAREKLTAAASEMTFLKSWVDELSVYQSIIDAEKRTREILDEANGQATEILATARQDAAQVKQKVEAVLSHAQAELDKVSGMVAAERARARDEAERIVNQALEEARRVAGSALDAKENAERYTKIARAMRNVIEGYGSRYVVPTTGLVDELANEYGHKDFGAQLKLVRQRQKDLIKSGRAADCKYVEDNRRTAAVEFALDAFNGKVDSIVSRVKHDNLGKLRQAILDAFELVNRNGSAFRDVRVTLEYRNLRLEELRLAVGIQEMKLREQEEQREIREKMREEERAKREFEKAIKAAAKEEKDLTREMDAMRARVATATEAQRAEYEAKLAVLEARLKEAEERERRAISMAQQTRRGHVYVISNIGSFGENVYKIGLTRRLDPIDRVRELGDASVPFPFDVHAMIFSEDAPALEFELQKRFQEKSLNLINFRKEFFAVPIAEIKKMLDSMGVQAHWTEAAAAREYRESIAIRERGEVAQAVARRGPIAPSEDDELDLDAEFPELLAAG
jgi:hypothetical protein